MTDGHLTKSLVRTCLENGFDRDRSVRLLVHLDRGCVACSKVLRAVAAGDAARHPTTDGGWSDPVTLALWRYVCVLRGDPSYPTGVTAPHVFWAERLPLDPTAFGRVVVEEAFRQALSRPGRPPLWEPYESFLENALSDPLLEELGTRRRSDLLALSRAYFAYPCRHMEAMSLAAEALGHLEKGTGDPEVGGTVWLYLSFSKGLPAVCLSRAEEHILRFLGETPSPGHHADLLVAQATHQADRKEYHDSYETLLKALAIVPDSCIWLRFQATRKLGFLEGANLVPGISGQERPSRYLLEAEQISRKLPGWRGRSLHATGQAALIARRHGLAKEKLEEAVSAYREEADLERILDCLGSLRILAVANVDRQALEQIKLDLREMVPGDLSLAPRVRQKVRTLARELDDLAWVREALDDPRAST